jgi:hypothetical protein
VAEWSQPTTRDRYTKFIFSIGEGAMKKRFDSESARMAGIRGALATLGAPIVALARKRETGRAILTNFAILAAAFTAVTAGSPVRRSHQYRQDARHSMNHSALLVMLFFPKLSLGLPQAIPSYTQAHHPQA